MAKVSIKDKIRQRAKDNKQSQSSSGIFKIEGFSVKDHLFKPKNEVMFDILNYTVTDAKHPDNLEVGDEWYRRPYKAHFVKVEGKARMFVCRRSIGEKCPICEYYARMVKAGMGDEAKELKAKERELYNVYDYADNKVKLFDYSYFNFGALLDSDLADDYIGEQYGDFPSHTDGFALRVRFSSESFGGKAFLKASRIDFMPRKKQHDRKMMQQVYNLDEILSVQSYEKLEAMFLNEADVDAEPYEENPDDFPEDDTMTHDLEEDIPEEFKPTSSMDCPNGYYMGTDCDTHPECESCPVWDTCADIKNEMKKQERVKK